MGHTDVKTLTPVPWACLQVLLVDGSGVLHPRRCGSASHLGVLADLPTVGVTKSPLRLPEQQAAMAEGAREAQITCQLRCRAWCMS